MNKEKIKGFPLKNKTDKYEVLRWGLLQLQVCSPLPPERIDEVLEDVRKNYPAGTSGNWGIDDREDVAPVKCASHEGFWHYVFKC